MPFTRAYLEQQGQPEVGREGRRWMESWRGVGRRGVEESWTQGDRCFVFCTTRGRQTDFVRQLWAPRAPPAFASRFACGAMRSRHLNCGPGGRCVHVREGPESRTAREKGDEAACLFDGPALCDSENRREIPVHHRSKRLRARGGQTRKTSGSPATPFRTGVEETTEVKTE